MEIISQNNTATNTYAIEVKFSAEEFDGRKTWLQQAEEQDHDPRFPQGKGNPQDDRNSLRRKRIL